MTIQAMTNRMVTLAIVLSLVTMLSAYVSFNHNAEARAALGRQVEFWRLGRSLTGGLERLNTATMRYALSGRDIYYETFWNELLITRSLDRALVGFEEFGSTEYEANLVESARDHAQDLVEVLKEVIDAVMGIFESRFAVNSRETQMSADLNLKNISPPSNHLPFDDQLQNASPVGDLSKFSDSAEGR